MTRVTIDGAKYPFRLTLGAMKEFKLLTGKEVESIDKAPDNEKVELILALVYACVKSASRREGITLAFSSFEEMLDCITPAELPDLVSAISADASPPAPALGSTKKKHPASMK
jgi:hypothetical protein